MLSASDLIEQEVQNAELIAKEAKEDMQRAKEKIAEEAEGSKPPIGGFESEDSISASSSNATTQVVVDSDDSSSTYDIADDSGSDSSSGISSHSAYDMVVGESSSSSDSTNDYATVVVSAVSPVSLSDSSENLDERLNGKEKDEANDTDNDNDDKVQKGHPDSKS